MALGVLSSAPSLQGMFLALLCVSSSLAFAVWPVKGRTPEQWLPVVMSWLLSTVTRRSKWSSSLPLEGRLALVDRSVMDDPITGNGSSGSAGQYRIASPMSPMSFHPGIERSQPVTVGPTKLLDRMRPSNLWPSPFSTLSRCTVLSLPAGVDGSSIGVVADPYMHTCSAVLRVRSSGFMLKDEAEQYEAVTRWGRILASAAQQGRELHRLQWLVRSYPSQVTPLGCHLLNEAAAPLASPQARSYEALIDTAERDALSSETLLVVSLRPPGNAFTSFTKNIQGKARFSIQNSLLQEISALTADLTTAGITTDGALSPSELLASLQRYIGRNRETCSCRGSEGGLEGRSGLERKCPPCFARYDELRLNHSPDNLHRALPLGTQASWSELRVDGTWHATYWIAEWPRSAVMAEFLAPLLLETGTWRSVSIVMEPVPPVLAIRQIEQQHTARLADDELKRRGGFLRTARERLEKEMLLQKEAELACGHGQYRFVGYVTASGWSKEALDRACNRVEHLASQCFLEIRRMYGVQDTAFTYSLPLARGLT